ncbi:MAG: preprotein translocase subunit SecE [Bacilli bacterium]|jgi:preprotein translocase SecE subunit|nr:preprotein translocase subunit SecE [Bacilli bacterium]
MAKKDIKETTKEVVDETKIQEKKAKAEKKKDTKKKTKKAERKAPKENYFVGVRNELSKVKWPSKKEVFKYTMATIIFVLLLVGFFILMSLVMSGIKGAFN